jgi:putative PIN family toxin of toxin-antitoxin system
MGSTEGNLVDISISHVILKHMKLVLDTDVMVAAIRSDLGASRLFLVAALEKRFEMLASTSLLIEYEAVMTRSKHLEASSLTVADICSLLDAVAGIARQVRLAFHWRPMLRDPDDDMVLETAVNGGADAIVTFNVKDFVDVACKFGIEIWRPGEAVGKLETLK